jgi:hypothetical protein
MSGYNNVSVCAVCSETMCSSLCLSEVIVLFFFLVLFCFCFFSTGIEPGALGLLGRCSTTE